MDTPPSPISDHASPVTWHVIIWVLFSLAVNSMAQPSAYSGATSWIYLVVSPSMCAADALTLLFWIPYLWYQLGGSIVDAIRRAAYWRLKGLFRETPAHTEDPGQASWLRCILFLVGTLPAIIKLAAFSGLPWTQTWGLMYSASYVVIEIVNIIPMFTTKTWPCSTAEALGCSLHTWNEDTNQELRKLAKDLDFTMLIICSPIWLLAVLGQIALDFWALYDLQPDRFLVKHKIWIPDTVYDSMTKAAATMFLTWLVLKEAPGLVWLITVISRVCNVWEENLPFQRQLARMKSFFRVLSNWWRKVNLPMGYLTGTALVVVVLFVSQENEFIPSSFVGEAHDTLVLSATLVGILGIWTIIESFWWLLCRKVPRLSQFLLVVEPDPPAAANEEDPESVSRGRNRLDSGIVRLTFFCCQIFITVLWYATRYDPEGTVNPAWTDVFG